MIDFENVRTDGIKHLDALKEDDVMVIFYSDQCKGITLDVIEGITNRNIKLKCYKVKIGTKNALDFQLSSYLGYILGIEQDVSCYIVSNDKGFDCLCDYWKEMKRDVHRIPSTDAKDMVVASSAPANKKKSKVKASDLATLDEIRKVLSKEDYPEEVLDIFNQFKTKVAINNGLAKKFKDTKRASGVYKKLKPLFKEKNKS